MKDNKLSRRTFIRDTSLVAAGLTAGLASAVGQAAKPKAPHIVFLTGDDEYRSEITMPFIAQLLGRRRQFKCTVVYAVNPGSGERNPKYQKNIEGLQALKTADLAVFFMRFRALPDEQLKMILDYVNSGKPIVGLRTSTHAFRYSEGHKNAKYNDGFGRDVFGQKWITHHGHKSTTKVSIVPSMAKHPILKGIYGSFPCSSWLYHVPEKKKYGGPENMGYHMSCLQRIVKKKRTIQDSGRKGEYQNCQNCNKSILILPLQLFISVGILLYDFRHQPIYSSQEVYQKPQENMQ